MIDIICGPSNAFRFAEAVNTISVENFALAGPAHASLLLRKVDKAADPRFLGQLDQYLTEQFDVTTLSALDSPGGIL